MSQSLQQGKQDIDNMVCINYIDTRKPWTNYKYSSVNYGYLTINCYFFSLVCHVCGYKMSWWLDIHWYVRHVRRKSCLLKPWCYMYPHLGTQFIINCWSIIRFTSPTSSHAPTTTRLHVKSLLCMRALSSIHPTDRPQVRWLKIFDLS